MSSMICLDIIGELPHVFYILSRKRNETARVPSGESPTLTYRISSLSSGSLVQSERVLRSDDGISILQHWGSPRRLRFLYRHCTYCTAIGSTFLLCQIALLAWSKIDSMSITVFALVAVSLFIAFLPLPGYMVFGFLEGFVEGYREVVDSPARRDSAYEEGG